MNSVMSHNHSIGLWIIMDGLRDGITKQIFFTNIFYLQWQKPSPANFGPVRGFYKETYIFVRHMYAYKLLVNHIKCISHKFLSYVIANSGRNLLKVTISQKKISFNKNVIVVISISRNGLLKVCARFIIERSEIRKKQHAFKSVHFECRMVLFYMIWEKSRL